MQIVLSRPRDLHPARAGGRRERRAARAGGRAADVSGARILVAGGGTAGHIEPAMNLADAVRRLDPAAEITALGTVKGLDQQLIPARGYPLELVPPVPLPRRVNKDLLATPGRVREAVAAAARVLERTRAEVVVGFGGYVAVPAYLAARRLGVPIVVHEANARPGLANRLAARLTTHVFTASPRARLKHAQMIGMPLRPAIARLDRAAMQKEARAKFGLHADAPTLLVFGGSQGAQSINRAAAGAAPQLRAAGVQVVHVIGPKNTLDVTPGEPPYLVLPYIEQMQYAYAAADFALCRCGAMTCAELAAVGLPAAYVPYPVGNGEQRFNALPIVEAGGGLLVDDAALDPEWILANVVPKLTDPQALAAMSGAAAHAGSRDGDVVLARHVLAVAEQNRKPTSPR
jgi:UDP-N-acetylglucosamine--N-acetylmuramyl-(pentapeptide) pyrophosphoryl-undecaprenol N-acetylglucosamine transferase